jgi:hypothetical protein
LGRLEAGQFVLRSYDGSFIGQLPAPEGGEYLWTSVPTRNGPDGLRSIDFVGLEPGKNRRTLLYDPKSDRVLADVPGLPHGFFCGDLWVAGGTVWERADPLSALPPLSPGTGWWNVRSCDSEGVLIARSDGGFHISTERVVTPRRLKPLPDPRQRGLHAISERGTKVKWTPWRTGPIQAQDGSTYEAEYREYEIRPPSGAGFRVPVRSARATSGAQAVNVHWLESAGEEWVWIPAGLPFPRVCHIDSASCFDATDHQLFEDGTVLVEQDGAWSIGQLTTPPPGSRTRR